MTTTLETGFLRSNDSSPGTHIHTQKVFCTSTSVGDGYDVAATEDVATGVRAAQTEWKSAD